MTKEIQTEVVEKFYIKDGQVNPTIGLKDYESIPDFLKSMVVAKVTIVNGKTTLTNHDGSIMNKDQGNVARKHFNSLVQSEYAKNRDDQFILDTIEKTDLLIEMVKDNPDMVKLINEIFTASGNNDQQIHTIKLMGAVHKESKRLELATNNLDDEWEHRNNENFPLGKVFATKKKSGKAYNPYSEIQTELEKQFPELYIK